MGVAPCIRLAAVILPSIHHSAETVGRLEYDLIVCAGYIENFKKLVVSYQAGIFLELPSICECYASRCDAFLRISIETEHSNFVIDFRYIVASAQSASGKDRGKADQRNR